MLHDVRTVDRGRWNALREGPRQEALSEAESLLESQLEVEDAAAGASGLYAVPGGKGDIMVVHLRPEIPQLSALESSLESTAFGEATTTTYSYLSLVELGGYSGGKVFDEDQDLADLRGETAEFVDGRLRPEIPDRAYASFYPMDKRRQGDDNWYTLPFKERARMMGEHGKTGRTYAGDVTQIISGSMALDDWEWGVTVFGNDPSILKEMVAQMRYDEVSARFGEFGPFILGWALDTADLGPYLAGDPVDPTPRRSRKAPGGLERLD
jgi:chlorite dismutase